jgi:hypothetical protein
VDFDILVVGDFRFPGGTSTAAASDILAFADAGYSVGLMPMAAPILHRPHPFNPAIGRLIQQGRATLVPQDVAVTARHASLHHPRVFETYPARSLRVTADDAVLVVHHPPVDATGLAQYDWRSIARIASDLFGDTVWAPVGPKVRAAFNGLAGAPNLTPADCHNVIHAAQFALPRRGFSGAVPVIGRHSRPDPDKWPDTRAAFLHAYPAAADLRVRLMGFGPELDAITGPRPANWQVLAFNAQPVRQFLASIDYFSYFHSPRWIEAFGRSILEAMASGAVPLLPPDFEPLFHEGALYCDAADVAKRVRALHADPAAYARQSEQAVAVVQDRFGPDKAVARIADRIGPPRSAVFPGAALPARRSRVLYLTSNGVGMGHLTRALASARRLDDGVEPVVVTMSKAFGVIAEQGIRGDYLPYHRSIGMDEATWQIHLATEVSDLIDLHRPDVFVFDGNVPYPGLVRALSRHPALWKVWERRGMWVPQSGEQHIRLEGVFDVVIEPGDFAGVLDRGLTRTSRSRTFAVPPVRFLREDEALTRDAARAEIGLQKEEVSVLLQLGSGNNFETTALYSQIFDHFAQRPQGPPLRIVLGEWLVGNDPVPLPDGAIRFRAFPFARYLAAFDFAVAMAGYNTFHENLHAALPTLFLANESPEQDEQWLRAQYAALRGVALAARSHQVHAVGRALDQISDASVRAGLQAACLRARGDNGADAVAEYLSRLATLRRPFEVAAQFD